MQEVIVDPVIVSLKIPPTLPLIPLAFKKPVIKQETTANKLKN